MGISEGSGCRKVDVEASVARPQPGTSPSWGFLIAAGTSSELCGYLAICRRRGRGSRAQLSTMDGARPGHLPLPGPWLLICDMEEMGP